MDGDSPSEGQQPVEDLAGLMKGLGDSTRLRILGLLTGGELNVTEICEQLGLQQPMVSHHLSVLRMLGVLHGRRVGKQIYYQFGEGVSAPDRETIEVERTGGTVRVTRRGIAAGGLDEPASGR